MIDMKFILKGITFDSPIFLASGTSEFGLEIVPELDNMPGALITKAITFQPREGNPPPRIVETPCGLLNSIGLENPGVDGFIKMYDEISSLNIPVIVNVAGSTISEYLQVIEKIEDSKIDIKGYEINISCPNVRSGGMAFGLDSKVTGELVSSIRGITDKLLLVKLSPNAGVVDILKVAESALVSGANALSLINTLVGMVIDIEKRIPILGGTSGGLSGAAIKPIGIYYVYWIRKHFPDIPIIGVGGITSGKDVVEYMMAGADAVQLGTASLIDPKFYDKVVVEFVELINKFGLSDYKDIKSSIHRREL